MKKLFLSIVFIMLNLFVFSQVTDSYWEKIESNAANFTQVSDSFNIYINSTYSNSIPSDKLGNIKNYFRFVDFWKSRIGLINDETSYKPYQDAIIGLLADPICDSRDPAAWELVGPVTYAKQKMGLVSQVLHDPNNEGSYILSSDYGGLWKSQETGNSWKNVTDALRIPGLSASELIRNPKNNNHLMASTTGGLHTASYGIGIIESFDNGDTWSVMQGFPYQNAPSVVKILYDPYLSTGSEIALYAITKKQLYLSLNSGQDWALISSPSISDFDDYVDVETTGSNIILLSTKFRYNATDGKIFRRTNGIWENIKNNNSFIEDFQVASFSTPHNGKIFMHCRGANGSDIYKTTNSGNSWIHIGEKFSSSQNEIEYSPESNIVYHGGIYIQYFIDDGTYTQRTIPADNDLMHVDIRDFDFMGIDADGKENILVATDGGISLCRLNIQNHTDYTLINLNGNHLPICEFVGFGVSHSSPEIIVGGAMHDGTHKYSNNQWNEDVIAWGDGGDCEINWLNPDIYYYMSNGSMRSSSSSSFSNSNSNWFIGMEYELNPNNPYILYYYYGKSSQNVLLGIYNEETDQNSVKTFTCWSKATWGNWSKFK